MYYLFIISIYYYEYSGTSLLIPPQKIKKSGLKRGVVLGEGFIKGMYEGNVSEKSDFKGKKILVSGHLDDPIIFLHGPKVFFTPLAKKKKKVQLGRQSKGKKNPTYQNFWGPVTGNKAFFSFCLKEKWSLFGVIFHHRSHCIIIILRLWCTLD